MIIFMFLNLIIPLPILKISKWLNYGSGFKSEWMSF